MQLGWREFYLYSILQFYVANQQALAVCLLNYRCTCVPRNLQITIHGYPAVFFLSLFFLFITAIWACWDRNGKKPHIAIYYLGAVKLCFSVVPVCILLSLFSSMREAMYYCQFPNQSLRVSCLEAYVLPGDSTETSMACSLILAIMSVRQQRNPQPNPTFFMAFLFLLFISC